MSDIEFITEMNHRRAREREIGMRYAELAKLRERREKVRRQGLTCCWVGGAFLSGMALVLMAFGAQLPALIFGAVAAVVAIPAVRPSTAAACRRRARARRVPLRPRRRPVSRIWTTTFRSKKHVGKESAQSPEASTVSGLFVSDGAALRRQTKL